MPRKKKAAPRFLDVDTINMIEGFTDGEEGDRLARWAATVPAGYAIVEVGSATGSGALFLAAGARAGNQAHVYAVDLWDLPVERNRPEAYARPEVPALVEARIAYLGFQDRITLVRSDSVAAAEEWGRQGYPVGLLHLDGDHSGEALERDLAAWLPHLARGAILIVHDINAPHEGQAGPFVDGLSRSGKWDEIGRYTWSRSKRRRGQWIGRMR